jgi:hypothetical protein
LFSETTTARFVQSHLSTGEAVLERSHRLEFGIERVLDNSSNVEATAFFDTTTGRGVGLMSFPSTAFSGNAGDAFLTVANQQVLHAGCEWFTRGV